MVERIGEMRKGRRERIEKESREGIEKETKRQFEEKEGLRDTPLYWNFLIRPCDVAIVSSSPQGCSSSIKNLFLQAYRIIESIIKKIYHGVKQNAKKKCAIGEAECNET